MRTGFVFFFWLCLALPGMAQDVFDEDYTETGDTLNAPAGEEDEVDAFHLDKNPLIFPSGKARFHAVYARMDSILTHRTGRLTILHMGGSHVQAGYFSNKMRANFRQFGREAEGSYGCLFPYAALNTNTPSGYVAKVHGRWRGSRCIERTPSLPLGLAGAAIRTSDPAAAIDINLNGEALQQYRWHCTRLRVLGEASCDSVAPYVVHQGDTVWAERDSTSYLISLPQPVEECTVALSGLNGKGERYFDLRGVIPENDQPGITFVSTGINGASVPSWLRCERFVDDLSYCPPDVVIFGIGINDAATLDFNVEGFKQNYRQLMTRIRQVNPQCAMIFITNNDCYQTIKRRVYNRNTPIVEQAFLQLAKESGGAVWNLYQIMGGFGSSSVWVSQSLMQKDHVHFTRAGYEVLGDFLYDAITTDFDTWKNQ